MFPKEKTEGNEVVAGNANGTDAIYTTAQINMHAETQIFASIFEYIRVV